MSLPANVPKYLQAYVPMYLPKYSYNAIQRFRDYMQASFETSLQHIVFCLSNHTTTICRTKLADWDNLML